MRYAAIDWRTLLGTLAAVALAASGVLYWRRWRSHDAEGAERQRRSHLNHIGRIAEGQILEILDAPAPPVETRKGPTLFRKRHVAPSDNPPDSPRKVVCYSYSISGVTYETAQDITGLEERVCLERVVAGQPASVKYDPSNPSNSILVADDWSGLH
ncbi:MAG TPA: hypothetical protein VKF40_16555 [Burkholderiales bacterium]|nr:hypothetical protein [Burkholderiales bacterium]